MFNIFISGLDKETKGNFNKFADNTKLESVADTLNGNASVQRDLERDEDLANKTCLKVNKEKCKVLHLQHYNPMHLYVQAEIC